MPTPWTDILHDAARMYPWLLLDEYVDGVGQHNLDRVASELVASTGGGPQIYGSFRLDDDDLLPVNFFDRCAGSMSDATVGMYISMSKGVTALYRDGQFSNFREVTVPNIAIGLLGISRIESNGRWTVPPRYASHHRVDEFAPVILDSRDFGYIWTRHAEQDTVYEALPDRKDAIITTNMGRNPEVSDMDRVITLFPTAFREGLTN